MSELNAKSRSRGSSLFWPTYMLSWALLAGGALTYLSLSTLQTAGSNRSPLTPSQSSPESNRAELDRAQLAAQVRVLNETVTSLRARVATLQTAQKTPPGGDVAANSASSAEPAFAPSDSFTSGITTSSIPAPNPAPLTVSGDRETARLTENKPQPAAPPAGEADATPQPRQPEVLNPTTAPASPGTEQARVETPAIAEAKPRPRRNLATIPLRSGRVPPLPPRNALQTSQQTNVTETRKTAQVNTLQPNVLNKAAEAIKTASLPVPTSLKPLPAAVVKPPPSRAFSFGAPTVKQASVASAALSLSTAQSVTGLRASWLLLTSRHPATFVGYQPRYVANQSDGTYQLIAGPIASHAEADRICSELLTQSVNCGVTSYVGSALR